MALARNNVVHKTYQRSETGNDNGFHFRTLMCNDIEVEIQLQTN